MSECFDCNIVCVMVTHRLEWILHAILNFHHIDYPLKKLLIVCHNQITYDYVTVATKENEPDIQVVYESSFIHMSLGELRNTAFEYIKSDDWVYPFDDDDWRHSQIFRIFMKQVDLSKRCGFSPGMYQFTHRLNYNLNTDGLWTSSDSRGLVHYLAPVSFLKTIAFQYKHQPTLEDTNIHDLSRRQKWLIDNEHCPRIYIRLTHDFNTSPFVQQNQSKAILNYGFYKETAVKESDTSYVEFVKKIVQWKTTSQDKKLIM